MKNKKLLIILATFLVLSALALNSVSSPGIASIPDSDGVITVIGESVIKAAPDQSIIVLAVETTSADAKTAVAENAKSTTAVVAALKKFGLKDDQIKTGSYNVYPYVEYVYEERPQEKPPTQYKAFNSLTITISDLDKVGQVIDTAINSGANQVQSVSFDLKNSEAVKLQALQQATIQAKAKGEAIAKGTNIKITGLKSITEEGSGYSPYRAPFQKEMLMDGVESSNASTPITPGEVEVYARVIVEYKF